MPNANQKTKDPLIQFSIHLSGKYMMDRFKETGFDEGYILVVINLH